jgi:cupin fold WbuC family metalloprotein
MGVLDQYHRDLSAKSLSFYSSTVTTVVNDALVDELTAKSEGAGKCNARICLHPNPDSNFHEMIILERKGYYFPPHRHVGKAQSVHILRGEAAVFVFDGGRGRAHCTVLGRDGNLIIRIAENAYHLTLPLTDYVVYHEGKPGPFLKEGDSIFADWAPPRDAERPVIDAYLDKLRELIP